MGTSVIVTAPSLYGAKAGIFTKATWAAYVILEPHVHCAGN